GAPPGSDSPPLPPPPAHEPGCEFADVLAARDLYAAIGASVLTPEAELRRCYLRTAVRAHPRAAATEEAAAAFQQATAAWAELASATSRWRYDAELQAGRGLLVGPARHRCLPLTDERALAAFASAAAHCAAEGPAPPGFEGVLRRARELAAAPAAEAEPAAPCAARAVATCAGLAAAGVVATAAGYPGVGLMARRAAIYQGLGQAAVTGASMYRSSDAVRERVDRICSVLGECAEATSSLLPPVAACLGDREGTPEPRPAGKVVWLPVGCHVRLVGLQSATSLNGRAGEVVGFRDARYEVKLLAHQEEGGRGASAGPALQVKRLRPENLEPLGSRPGLESPPCGGGAPQGASDFF
ncbi:unnamed protein product, partial [Prorocentrum cordatum]